MAVRTSGSEAEELAVGKNSGEQLREVTQVLQGADVLEAERPFETSGRLKIECKGRGVSIRELGNIAAEMNTKQYFTLRKSESGKGQRT